jgi:hypothetical protein
MSTNYKTTVTPKINILMFILKLPFIIVTVVLYFIKILSGSRNLMSCLLRYLPMHGMAKKTGESTAMATKFRSAF